MLSYDKMPMATRSSVILPSAASPQQRKLATMIHSDRHVFVVAGPAGSGKTTLAKYLAVHFGFEYLEGDDFHPPENVQKMRNSIPLQDADRWDWLINLREAAMGKLEAGASSVVLTCSALKRKYRDVIRIASVNEHNIHVHFLILNADRDLLYHRAQERATLENHYMPPSLIDSQLRDFELTNSREKDVVTIDVSGSISQNQELAVQVVQQAIGAVEQIAR